MKSFLRYLIVALGLCLLPVSAQAASRFAVCTATCTWDGSSTAMWSASSGGATGASVPGAADAVTFDANTCVGGLTCTITVNTNVNIATFTFGACTASTTGCVLDFSVNNNNFTSETTNWSGAGTRSLKMGSGTFTCTNSTNSCWNISTATGMTLSAGTSTLVFPVFSVFSTLPLGAGFTYATITFPAQTSGHAFALAGLTTIGTLNLTAPQAGVAFNNSMSITNPLVLAGNSANQIQISGSGSTLTVAAGSSLDWCALEAMTFAGVAVNATNSFNLGANNMNGGSITSPASGGHIIGG